MVREIFGKKTPPVIIDERRREITPNYTNNEPKRSANINPKTTR